MGSKTMGLSGLWAVFKRPHLWHPVLRAHISHISPVVPNNYCLCRLLSSKAIQPAESTGTDYLLRNLRSSTDSSDLLQVVGNHYSVMNEKHVMHALRYLFQLQKSGGRGMAPKQLLENSRFRQLCKRLHSKARTLGVNDVVEALKVVQYLGVSTDSTLVQTLLQLVRHRINELSLQQMVFMAFLLHSKGGGPLADALRIALPMVFEAQLASQLNDSIPLAQLADMLKFTSKHKVSDSSVMVVVNALESCTEEMDARVAASVARSLCELHRPLPQHAPLLHKALNRLAGEVQHSDYDSLELVLGFLAGRYARGHVSCLHPVFMDACVHFVIDKDCGVEKAAWVLRRLNRMGHINLRLLDYMTEQFEAQPAMLESCRAVVVITWLSGLALADYHPQSWPDVSKVLARHPMFCEVTSQDSMLPWLRVTLDLACLGTFWPSLLHQIFTKEFLTEFLGRDYSFLDQLQLLLLHQAVVTLCPSYQGPLTPPDIIEAAAKANGGHVKEFPLQGALERGLGGGSYVLTGAYTKMGHYIDHVVVMRNGGFPVALPSCSGPRTYIEDLPVPPDSWTVLVLAMPAVKYATNTARLRGMFALEVRTLEALGYVVVPVNVAQWRTLPDHEKIPQLMQSMRKEQSGSLKLSNVY